MGFVHDMIFVFLSTARLQPIPLHSSESNQNHAEAGASKEMSAQTTIKRQVSVRSHLVEAAGNRDI